MADLTPPPEVVARLAEPHEIPRGAATVQHVALAAGWTVVATYARGTLATGVRVPRVIDNLALRMSMGRCRAVAVWEDGKFTTAYLWGDAPLRKIGNHQLKTHLEGSRERQQA